MKKTLALVLALCMVFALCACGSTASTSGTSSTASSADTSSAAASTEAAPAADTSAAAEGLTGVLKLGCIGPLTGGAALYGNAVKNAEQIAVDEINAIDPNFQIELSAQDDEHDAEKSVNAYHNLQDWGVQAIAGTVTTTPCLAVAAEAYADRVFMLTPSASSTSVTEGKDNVFQVCFTDPNQGSASAQYIADNKLAENIAIIYNNSDAYSTGIYNTFASEAAELGLNIVSTTTFTDDTANDFSVQLADAQKNGADLIFLPIYYTPASLIMTQANTMGYDVTLFGVDGMDGILDLEGFDTSLAEGTLLLTPFAADATDDLTVNFVTAYNTAYNETPNQFAADAYDAVYAIYDALKLYAAQNGSLNVTDMSASDMCDLLISVFTSSDFSVDGLTGEGMTWNANGEVNKAPKAVVIENGAYVGR